MLTQLTARFLDGERGGSRHVGDRPSSDWFYSILANVDDDVDVIATTVSGKGEAQIGTLDSFLCSVFSLLNRTSRPQFDRC